jgi:hypothetical protein
MWKGTLLKTLISCITISVISILVAAQTKVYFISVLLALCPLLLQHCVLANKIAFAAQA